MKEYCEAHSSLERKIDDNKDTLNAVYTIVKVLESEFKAMNGSLRDTKIGHEKHVDDSKNYRHRVDVMWSTVNTIKWAVALLFGSGVLWKILERWVR